MQQIILVTTSKIQPYIFGSNRLRENIGASYLVYKATEDWPEELTNKYGGKRLYAGGGNYVARFKDEESVSSFKHTLSRRVLQKAPNLQLLIVQQEIERGEKAAVKAAFDELELRKRSQQTSTPLLGLGVTQDCQSTGLPATKMTEPIRGDETSSYPASSEIHAKLAMSKPAREQLRDQFQLNGSYTYPYDFDDLGRTAGEHSFIAVVHADGNDMGRRVKDIRQEAQSDEDYITRMEEFSEKLKKASSESLKATINHLVENVRGDTIRHPKLSKLEIKLKRVKESYDDVDEEEKGKLFIPIRPIVFGGDDLTFVCDGRLGIALACLYIQEFHHQTKEVDLPGGPATACAGVAIVKAHYPFARAYALAEALSRSAKNYRIWLKQEDNDWDGSCLDWHFAISGLSGSLHEIRDREYTVPLKGMAGSLTMRPVTIEANPYHDHTFRAWPVVKASLKEFQGDVPDKEKRETWAGKRNKMKSLREALRQGEDAVEKFITMYQLKNLPNLGVDDEFSKGWSDEKQKDDQSLKYCGYFDALELADFFIPLKEKTDES